MGFENLAIGYMPSDYEPGRTLQVPANYGTDGSQAKWEWVTTDVPANGARGVDPAVPLSNTLDPVVWTLQVPTEEIGFQASVQQTNGQRPALFVPPGTASLDFKG